MKDGKRGEKRRATFALLAALLLLAGLGVWGGNWQAVRTDAKIRVRILQEAVDIARAIDPELARKLTFTAANHDTPAFETIRTQLPSPIKGNSTRGIYTLAQQGGKIVFGPGSYLENDPMANPPGAEYQQPPAEYHGVFKDKRPTVVGPVTNEFGTFISALAPVLDPNNGSVLMAVGMDVLADDWQAQVNAARRRPYMIALCVFLLLLAVRISCTVWGVLGLLAAGLIGTELAIIHIKQATNATSQLEFDFTCNEIRLHILDRLAANAQLLRSGAALFDASETVERQEWRAFTQSLKINQQLPGIQGLGFALLFPREQLAQHVQNIRREGFPDYQVYPAGEREFYSAITFIEPFTNRNCKAFGYDMFSEPVRRAAMEWARDKNAAALSGKVVLVQETGQVVQAGTLMYVPVYRHGLPLETLEQRRTAIQGWVYSPYRMTDLMRAILNERAVKRTSMQIYLQVFDSDEVSARTLIYDGQNVGDKVPAYTGQVVKLIPVDFAGRRWTLRFVQLGGPATSADNGTVLLVTFSGTIITLLLCGLILSLNNMRTNAQRMAKQKTALLDALVNSTLDGILIVDSRGKRLLANTQLVTMFAIPESVMADDDDAAMLAHVTSLIKNPDQFLNKVRHLYDHRNETSRDEIALKTGVILDRYSAPVQGKDGECYGRIWTLRDSTAHKQTMTALRESEHNFRHLFRNNPAPMAISSLPDLRFIEVNPAFLNTLGYSRNDIIGKTAVELGIFPHPEQQSAAAELLKTQGRFTDLELIVQRKDGVTLTGLFSGEMITNQGQKYSMTVMIDISDRNPRSVP